MGDKDERAAKRVTVLFYLEIRRVFSCDTLGSALVRVCQDAARVRRVLRDMFEMLHPGSGRVPGLKQWLVKVAESL